MRVFRSLILLITALWVTLLGAGFCSLWTYEATPGSAGRVASRWPRDSRLPARQGCANLVLALHPHCPCSRATLEELERLMARCAGRLAVHALFVRPTECAEGWERTELWRRAAAIPGVHPWADAGATEATRFGAETSGHALLFDAAGNLQFSGGITNSRGHAGESLGRATIEALVLGKEAPATATPVFGCPLCRAAANTQE